MCLKKYDVLLHSIIVFRWFVCLCYSNCTENLGENGKMYIVGIHSYIHDWSTPYRADLFELNKYFRNDEKWNFNSHKASILAAILEYNFGTSYGRRIRLNFTSVVRLIHQHNERGNATFSFSPSSFQVNLCVWKFNVIHIKCLHLDTAQHIPTPLNRLKGFLCIWMWMTTNIMKICYIRTSNLEDIHELIFEPFFPRHKTPLIRQK